MQTLPNSKFNPLTVILLVQLPCQSARLEQIPTWVFLLDIISQAIEQQNSVLKFYFDTLFTFFDKTHNNSGRGEDSGSVSSTADSIFKGQSAIWDFYFLDL
jgi:hypothetical protein